ncbi:MAG: hypothetical protein WA988_09405, partial [Candidatus Nanopelagicales bacterium]
MVAIPRWDDHNGGTMVRGALWLLQVVGEGNTFTKNQLRQAFPGVSQIDRRIRDLRDYGWVIRSSSEDASLLRDDQRFVAAGAAVWDPKARRAAAPAKTTSTKDRAAALERDGYMCTLCGIAGGENYPEDAYMSAVLMVARRSIVDEHGVERTVLTTECKRCNAGTSVPSCSLSDLTDIVDRLEPADRRRLLRWIESGRRRPTPVDRAWVMFRRLAASE